MASTDAAAIRNVYAAWFAALEAQDALGAGQLVTKDYEAVDQHGGVISGRTDFEEMIALFGSDLSLARFSHSVSFVTIAGDEAEVDLSVGGTMTSPDGTRIKHGQGRSRDRLRRARDGRWQIHRQVSEYVGPPDVTDMWEV